VRWIFRSSAVALLSLKVTPSLITSLLEPQHYIAAIERLRSKHHYIANWEEPGGSLAMLYAEREAVAEAICADMAAERYQVQPAQFIRIHSDGKLRNTYRLATLDKIVSMVVARVLSEAFDPVFSDHLWSYRKQRSRYQVLTHFGRMITQHRDATPEVKQRGLYVLRTDIAAYGESVGVHPTAPLWGVLAGFWMHSHGNAMTPQEKHLLEMLIRPVVKTEEGYPYQLAFGIPDGTPLAPLLLNCYISAVDKMLGAIPGGFYARYGDDILFAHPDLEQVIVAQTQMDDSLHAFGLARNAKKTRLSYFNAAGRAPHIALLENTASLPPVTGVNHVEFLGLRIDFTGRIFLSNSKTSDTLKTLKRRLKATQSALKADSLSLEETLPLLCQVASDTLQNHSLFGHSTARVLHRHVNDRAQLKHMDYAVARLILSTLTQHNSVKAFRQISYKRLRQAGLYSVEYARNK